MLVNLVLRLHHFNSIKVQLKHSEFGENMRQFLFQFHKGTIKTHKAKVLTCNVVQFQFHKGTIRTISTLPWIPATCTFQFHKGTIRTIRQMENRKQQTNFNSIKVRLEQRILQLRGSSEAFQFHKGTIRTLKRLNLTFSFSYFNSIKVRLERWLY